MSQCIGRNKIALHLAGWPPSVNTFTTVVRGRKIKTKKARVFCESVVSQIEELRERIDIPFLKCHLKVYIILHPPSRQLRDIDNYNKGILDAMTSAHVWEDDSQVRKLTTEWGEVIKGGSFRIDIEEYDG